MCEQIRTRTRHWTMLRYWLLVFRVESKLENKLVVSLSCRLGIARHTKVSIRKKMSQSHNGNKSRKDWAGIKPIPPGSDNNTTNHLGYGMTESLENVSYCLNSYQELYKIIQQDFSRGAHRNRISTLSKSQRRCITSDGRMLNGR
jgi:hypothetical protein